MSEKQKPVQLLNAVDKAISFFNPQYGVRAMVARSKINEFGYNDNPNRRGRSGGMYNNASSESWAKHRDRNKAMWDARDLVQYDWIGGVIARLVLYVCGTINCKSTTGDEKFDEAYDSYFHNWCGDELSEDGTTMCDITGRHRFLKIVQFAFLGHIVDGDHGIVEIGASESPNGSYCLQNIQADRIGSPLEATVGETYIGGITIDPGLGGRIVSYRVYERTRMSQYVNPREVLPQDFIHVFDPEHSDEFRGRTKLLRVLNDLRDIREWIEAEKIAGKTQSQYAALIGTKDPTAQRGATAWSGKTNSGTPSQDAEWGKILKLADGESFSMLSPSARPSGAFLNFVQTIIRKIATALDLPFGFVWDLSMLGGVTARIEVQAALRRIQYWQQNLLVNKILNRVRQKVIAQGIAQGVLQPHPNWKACEWHFGPWISTDAGYEMQSDVQGVQTGIIPITQVTAKYGQSPREVFKSNASVARDAINVGAESQIPVEVFAKGLYPDITNMQAAMLTPPQPPPPAGSIEALGDKGVSKLLDLIEGVGNGTIDRESGIAAAMTIFGISRQKAEKLIPEQGEKEEEKEESEKESKKPKK